MSSLTYGPLHCLPERPPGGRVLGLGQGDAEGGGNGLGGGTGRRFLRRRRDHIDGWSRGSLGLFRGGFGLFLGRRVLGDCFRRGSRGRGLAHILVVGV